MARGRTRLICFLLLAAAALVAGGMVAVGLVRWGEGWSGVVVAAGLLGLVVAAVGAAVVMSLANPGGAAGSLADPRSAETSTPTAQRIETLLEHIHEHTLLSDSAKRVIFREKERQVLRSAIEEDIHSGDYDAALVLCDAMAESFGYREEAEQYRDRILQLRKDEYEAQVQEAARVLDECLDRSDWAAAYQEAARIRRLFPESHIVQDLNQRIVHARDQHKQRLEREFLDASADEDVATAMELLKQLDRYLTPDEAQKLTQVAQGIIAKHRESLGAEFRRAVRERRWADASRLGDTIVREYPNTKMAEEVRTMIDLIRTRATQAAVAAGTEH